MVKELDNAQYLSDRRRCAKKMVSESLLAAAKAQQQNERQITAASRQAFVAALSRLYTAKALASVYE
jgi:hypothetical protein